MTGNVSFLMKVVLLLAVSLYLVKEDVLRAAQPAASEVAAPVRMPGQPQGMRQSW